MDRSDRFVYLLLGEIPIMGSRYIPINIDREIKERHFFECAWCGEKLTERHHIIEFSQGGNHTTENLILLCPNCHTQVHKNEITIKELIERKSTHAKGDRLSGGVQFEMTEPFVRLGNAQFKDVPILVMYRQEPIISLNEINHLFFLSTRFYNSKGDLIFWMSSNRYWTTSDFSIQSKKDELIIFNNEDENNKLRIWEMNGVLNVEGKNYINGMLMDFNPFYIRIGNSKISAFSATKCTVGVAIG